jgi:hypothetical protein
MDTGAMAGEAELLHRFEEFQRCRADFWYWCTHYVRVLDGASGEFVLFKPYPGQRRIGDLLLKRKWMWAVKARRLGITTIALLVILHGIQFHAHRRGLILSQDVDTAREILGMYEQLERTQPEWMIGLRDRSNTTHITYAHGSSIKVSASGTKAGRSLNVHYLLADEAAYVERLGKTLSAAEPTLETCQGLGMVISTANGPGDDFHGGYIGSKKGKTKYTPVFLDCFQRPGRDEGWYEREDQAHAHQHQFMQREYPRDDAECFEAGGGRVYAGLTRQRHFVSLEMPDGAHRYRTIDWGNSHTSPFVCVWLWHDATSIPRLTFEPDCDTYEGSPLSEGKFADGLDQMFAYRRDEDTGKIVKLNDDLPDALRYGITHYRLTGHVHVYQVLMIRPDDALPRDPLYMGRRVLEMSGWEQDIHRDWHPLLRRAETYQGSVGDRSGVGFIRLWAASAADGGLDLAVSPARRLQLLTGRDDEKRIRPKSESEVEQGIAWVNALILGVQPLEQHRYRTLREARKEQLAAGTARPAASITEALQDEVLRGELDVDQPALYGYQCEDDSYG